MRRRLVLLVLACGTMAACAAPAVQSSAPSATEFSSPSSGPPISMPPDAVPDPVEPASFWAFSSGDPYETDYGSLESMLSAVDLVVVATPTGSVKGREVLGNEDGDTGYFATVFLEVEATVAGGVVEAQGRELKMETFLGAGYPWENDHSEGYARYAASLPMERALLFLTNKGKFFERGGLEPDDPGGGYDYYMLWTGCGFIRDVDGRAEPTEYAPEWLEALRGRPFDEVVAQVRELGDEAQP